MEILVELKKIFGDRLSSSPEVLEMYSRDYWPYALLKQLRGKWTSRPLVVVWPETVEEVVEVVKLANRYRVPIVPYAGGSGVTGAAVCDKCIVVDVKRMNKVLEFSDEDLIVTAEAGIHLKKLEEYLNERGFTLRHIPQSYPEAVIGGLIATFSTGQFSTKYGGIEDILEAAEIVTPRGEVIWTKKSRAPRAALGPDLKHLIIGSEGMFGIVTKARLRILPLPPYVWMNSYSFSRFEDGLRAVRELMVRELTPAIARLYDISDSLLRFKKDTNLLLLIFEEYSEELLENIVKDARKTIRKYGGVEEGRNYVKKWLKTRFDVISEIKKTVVPLGLWYETIETAGYWSVLPRLYHEFREKVGKVKGVSAVLAHASHFYKTGGCIYFTLVFESKEEVYWRVWEKAVEVILDVGATLSHHHGIGLLRAKWIREELGEALEVLRAIKKALDPSNILNPGKWL